MKRLVFIVVSLVLFVVVALYVNQDRDMKLKIRLADQSYMDDVRITQKKDGAVAWALAAKQAVFADANDVRLSDITIEFPQKELTLTADGGRFNIEKRDLRIDGNIRASTDDYNISAESLLWDSSKNELVSDKRVSITGKKFHIEGDTLRATKEKATLENNVKAVFEGVGPDKGNRDIKKEGPR